VSSVPSSSIGSFLSKIAEGSRVEEFRKHQVIYSSGDRTNSLYYIVKGRVKLTLTSKTGREAIVAVLNGGSVFGERALYDANVPRQNEAVALTDIRAQRIERAAMLRFIRTHRDGCDAFIMLLIRTSAQAMNEHADNLLYSSEKRLALALLSLARLGGLDAPHRIPKMSQQDLASMIGVSRQRVNVLMNRFRQLGAIDYSRGITVHGSISKICGRAPVS